ncbi:MAG: methylmalonyl Co-A mutase-associated GTPase MeaB [Bacteroidia bacterium]
MPASRRLPAEAYITGVLAGDRLMLSRAITLVESQLPADRQLAAKVVSGCFPKAGNAFRVGITGVPGVGKSTFIDGFGNYLVEHGASVAVLAVDPSSTRTGGSILGDKTRMEKLSSSTRAYVRPTPTSGHAGGVARNTRETIVLCEAAGYEWILVETVGVGQSEIQVAEMVDFFLLLLLPNAGDELQGMKRGIMELADGLVIHKSDGEMTAYAGKTRAAYLQALSLFHHDLHGWNPPVISASSITHTGYHEIKQMLHDYREQSLAMGFHQEKRHRQIELWLDETLRQRIIDNFLRDNNLKPQLDTLRQDVLQQRISPSEAVERLLKNNGNITP